MSQLQNQNQLHRQEITPTTIFIMIINFVVPDEQIREDAARGHNIQGQLEK